MRAQATLLVPGVGADERRRLGSDGDAAARAESGAAGAPENSPPENSPPDERAAEPD